MNEFNNPLNALFVRFLEKKKKKDCILGLKLYFVIKKDLKLYLEVTEDYK